MKLNLIWELDTDTDFARHVLEIKAKNLNIIAYIDFYKNEYHRRRCCCWFHKIEYCQQDLRVYYDLDDSIEYPWSEKTKEFMLLELQDKIKNAIQESLSEYAKRISFEIREKNKKMKCIKKKIEQDKELRKQILSIKI